MEDSFHQFFLGLILTLSKMDEKMLGVRCTDLALLYFFHLLSITYSSLLLLLTVVECIRLAVVNWDASLRNSPQFAMVGTVPACRRA